MWKDEASTALNPVEEQEENELVYTVWQMPCSWPPPPLCTSLGLREGDLLSPGLQPLPGPFCAGISCSWNCRARGKQSTASCFSTPATTRSPQPQALTPSRHGGVSQGCALACTHLPDCLHGNCPCLQLRRAGAGTYFYGFFSV